MISNKVLTKLLMIACFVFMASITVLNYLPFFKNRTFIYTLPLALVFFLAYIVARWIKTNPVIFSIFVFISAFTLKMVTVLLYNVPPASDFANFYDAAVQVANGDFSFASNQYFKLWAYQTGIVSYYAILIKLFGSGLIALKAANCLFIAGTNVILYLIARKIVNEKVARFVAFLYIVYPAPFFLASVLTNQHIANFFMLLGIFIFVSSQRKNPWGLVLSGLSIALGNAMRPQAIVVVLAIAAYMIIDIIHGFKDRKYFKQQIINMVSFLLAYMIFMQGMSFGVEIVGLNDNGLKNTFPLYKFVVGLNLDTNGCYSQEDTQNLISLTDTKVRDEKSIQLIKQRISNPRKFFNLLINKQKYMWAGTDDTVQWGFGFYKNTGVNVLIRNISYPKFKLIVQSIEKFFYIFIFSMGVLGLITSYRKKNVPTAFIVAVAIILLNFCIYSLIETQNRYRDFQLIFMFLAAAAGIESLENFNLKNIWFPNFKRPIISKSKS